MITATQFEAVPQRLDVRPSPPPTKAIDDSVLVPERHLQFVATGGYWRATGSEPRFLVPCRLPTGWIRVRYTFESPFPTTLKIFADFGAGFSQDTCIERLPVGRIVERDCYVCLTKPVKALCIDPIDAPGRFRLQGLRITAEPALLTLAKAVAGKLAVVRRYGYAWQAARHGLGLLLRGQITTIGNKLAKGLKGAEVDVPPPYDPDRAYALWRQNQALTEIDRQRLRAEASTMSDKPLISVLLAVANDAEVELRETIQSVMDQVYPHWELCLAWTAQTPLAFRKAIEDLSRNDARIRIITAKELGAGSLLNQALAIARGAYVAALNASDRLAEQALQSMARTIVTDPTADFVYSDEDRIDRDGRHLDPFFKPDWSPEFLLGCPYACRFAVQRTELVRDLGGWRDLPGHAREYDLVLRVAARTSRIIHIPDILYHKRGPQQPDSMANEATSNALAQHLGETGRSGSIEPGPAKEMHRVRFAIAGNPQVSIIIPTAAARKTIDGRDDVMVTRCVRSIRQSSTWGNYEIIVVADPDFPAVVRESLSSLGAHVMPYLGPFNFSAKIDAGAAQAVGDHLLLLNDDTEVISPDWLERMLEFSQQDDIGTVGAMLLLPSGRLQHAGINLLAGVPRHAYPGLPHDHPGHGHANLVPRNCLAVTGACLMTRTQVFRELGGLDVAFPLAYNDIDYCLRLRLAKRRVVLTPYARLYHYEASTRGGECGVGRDLFQSRWAKQLGRDPYYNLNLSQMFPDYRIDPDAPRTSRSGMGVQESSATKG